MKILLVEDDPTIWKMTIRVLRRMFGAIDPWVAESADHAIEHLRTAVLDQPFDLIISDWDLLGGQNGQAVLEWIRLHASQLERRFMFFSANAAAAKQRVFYLEKPSGLATIVAAITTVCGQT